MKEAIWNRVGPATGLLFFALVFTGLFIHGYPDQSPSDQQLQSWIQGIDVGRFTTGVYIEELGQAMFIPFCVWLYLHLRRGDGSAWTALVMLAAGLAWTTVTLPINELYVGMLEQGRRAIDIHVAQTVLAISQTWFEMTFLPQALFFLAVGASILRGGALARWAGWAALALGLALLIPGPIMFAFGMLPYLAVLLVAGYYTWRPPLSRESGGLTSSPSR